MIPGRIIFVSRGITVLNFVLQCAITVETVLLYSRAKHLQFCFVTETKELKPSGHYVYHRDYIIIRSAHTVYLCVLCGFENKQRLFPYTALTGWFL